MNLYNFRDLGGLPTKCERQTKHGLLFRTGNVAHWNEKSAQHVAHNLKVRLYIDFREPEEVEKFGRPDALVKEKIEWLPLSMYTSDETFENIKLPKAHDWIELYKRIFEKNFASWAKFASIIASESEPILYGCLFGKDRTGIASSLLLNILDVHDTHIVQDYTKTTDHIEPLSKMFFHILNEGKVADEKVLFEHFGRSHADVMLGFLEYMRTHEDQHVLGKELKTLVNQYREPLKSRLLVELKP